MAYIDRLICEAHQEEKARYGPVASMLGYKDLFNSNGSDFSWADRVAHIGISATVDVVSDIEGYFEVMKTHDPLSMVFFLLFTPFRIANSVTKFASCIPHSFAYTIEEDYLDQDCSHFDTINLLEPVEKEVEVLSITDFDL